MKNAIPIICCKDYTFFYYLCQMIVRCLPDLRKIKKFFLENVEKRRKNALQILKVVVLYRGSLTKAVCAGVKQREYVHHFPPYHIFLSLGSLRFTRGLSFDFFLKK